LEIEFSEAEICCRVGLIPPGEIWSDSPPLKVLSRRVLRLKDACKAQSDNGLFDLASDWGDLGRVLCRL